MMRELPRVPADRFADCRLLVRGERAWLVWAGRRAIAREVRASHDLPSGTWQVASISRRVCYVHGPKGLRRVVL